MQSPRRFFTILALIAGAVSLGLQATSTPYPDKPVRVIVPFAPGGATDVVARSLAKRLGEIWNQAVIVETSLEPAATSAPTSSVRSWPRARPSAT
jgi:tripartite-type tricarboxylate transporter receptor subunit TctC